MDRWQPARRVSVTFPFVDDFQVTILQENQIFTALISDGRARLATTVSCSGDHPDRATLRATRAAADQPPYSSTPAPDTSTFIVMLRCASSEPPAN